MNTVLIKEKCDKLIKDFALELGCVYPVEIFENKKNTTWNITLNTIKISFTYFTGSKLTIPNSTLFCELYLEKNSDFPYSIYQVIDYLGIDDFRCYNFGFIENEERAEACFNTIAYFIKDNLNAINELSVSDFDFKEKRKSEIKRVLKITDDKVDEFAYAITNENQIARYTDYPAYKLFLKGEYKKSLKHYYKLKKKNTCYDYELKLIDFMEQLLIDNEQYEAISTECASMLVAQNHNGTSKTDLMAMLVSVLVAYAILITPLIILYILIFWLFNRGTIFEFSVAEAVILAAICTVVPAIFGGFGFVDKIKVLISKNKQEAADFIEVLNPPKTKKFAQITSIIMIVLSVFFGFMISTPQAKCYEDYMLCDIANSDFAHEYERYNYSDVKSIYKIDGVYNEHTDKIMNEEAYIIRFSNGDVNTYYYLEFDDVNETLLPQIQKYYKGDIEHKASDLDL